MSPILKGIVASSKLGIVSNDFEAIATFTVTGASTASITFSSIPATYQHLVVRGVLRSDRSGYTQTGNLFRLNGDTGSNYNWGQMYSSSGGTPTYESYANETALRIGEQPAANAPTSNFGFTWLQINDYASTNKYKTYHQHGGSDRNGTGFFGHNFGNWRSLSAVNSITFTEGAANYIAGTTFSLYGIKG
jgi:hypothetical protein